MLTIILTIIGTIFSLLLIIFGWVPGTMETSMAISGTIIGSLFLLGIVIICIYLLCYNRRDRFWTRLHRLSDKVINAYNSNKDGAYLRYLNRYLKYNRKHKV